MSSARGNTQSSEPSRAAAPAAERPAGRAMLRDIVAYDTDRAPSPLELGDNTNPFGAPPSALRAVRGAPEDDLFRYPGYASAETRRLLAAYAGVRPDEIITGCGSDDVLESTFAALAEPGEAVAYSEPTFSMIPPFIRLGGLVPVPVAFTATHDIDADALLATKARIIYVCTPNNPTGTEASRRAVERVLEQAPGIVVIDEAYAEFAEHRYMPLAAAHGRLVVTRTMSKAWGMAGMRFGYGAAAPALIAEIEKVRGPYRVSALTERAVVAALTHDADWTRHTVRRTTELRERLALEMRTRGLAPLPSAANFVLVPMAGAPAVAAHMREHGVVIRGYRALPGIGDALRISVGTDPEIDAVMRAFDAARAATGG